MKSLNNLLIILFLACLEVSCDKEEEPEIIPSKAILGKWEVIKNGISRSELKPVEAEGFTEYLADSTVWYFDYEENAYTNVQKYWFQDSLYYLSETTGDETEVVIKFHYEFMDSGNKFLLELPSTALIRVSVLKRIDAP